MKVLKFRQKGYDLPLNHSIVISDNDENVNPQTKKKEKKK
jgi:hypothetical protein